MVSSGSLHRQTTYHSAFTALTVSAQWVTPSVAGGSMKSRRRGVSIHHWIPLSMTCRADRGYTKNKQIRTDTFFSEVLSIMITPSKTYLVLPPPPLSANSSSKRSRGGVVCCVRCCYRYNTVCNNNSSFVAACKRQGKHVSEHI